MTITLSTDPIVATTTTAAWLVKELTIAKIEKTKTNHQERKYERKIRKSQKKIGPYIP